jgi:holo-[acyl-carrier protein] synthase
VNVAAGATGSPGVFVGVGIDAVDIERFSRVLRRRPTLADRVFSTEERAEAAQSDDPIPLLAARFAAKEAVMKALGTGLWAFPLRDAAVLSAMDGTSTLRLGPRAAELAEQLGVVGWHISLTVEPPMAMAVVLAEGSAMPVESRVP